MAGRRQGENEMVPLPPAPRQIWAPNAAGDGYLRQSGRRGRVRGSRGSSCGLWSFVHFMGLCIRIPSLSAGIGTVGISWRWQHPRHLSPIHISPEICKSPVPQPTSVKPGTSHVPQRASHQSTSQPFLPHWEGGVGTAKSPRLGRSSQPSEQSSPSCPKPSHIHQQDRPTKPVQALQNSGHQCP